MAKSRTGLSYTRLSSSEPVLLIQRYWSRSATHDRVAPVSEAPELGARWKTHWLEVPGGHAVTIQNASLISRHLRAFWDSVASTVNPPA